MNNVITQSLESKQIRGILGINRIQRTTKRVRSVSAIVETTPLGMVVNETIIGTDILYTYPWGVKRDFNPSTARENVQTEVLEPRYYNFGRMENIVYVDESKQFINSVGMKRKPCIGVSKNELADTLFVLAALKSADTFISKNYRNPEVCILWEDVDNRLERNY